MLRKNLHWLPVVLWMGVIFTLSSGLGGADHTSRFLGPLLRWLMPHAAPETLAMAHFLIRKAAHLTEYAVLAILALRAVRQSLQLTASGWSWKAAGLALLISASYAATDEFHQSFVPGRTSAPGDVLIDSSGAVAALALAALRRKIAAEIGFPAGRKWRPRRDSNPQPPA